MQYDAYLEISFKFRILRWYNITFINILNLLIRCPVIPHIARACMYIILCMLCIYV